MLRRYRKIEGDMPLCSGEDRGQYSVCNHSAVKLLDDWYLPLSFISLYLHKMKQATTSSVVRDKEMEGFINKVEEEKKK